LLDPGTIATALTAVKPLTDLGGWVFSVIVMAGVLVMISRGSLVPGWVYQHEVQRGDKATETAAKAVDALSATTDAINKLAVNSATQNSLLEGFIAGSRRKGA
jgi:hypothetical protein